MIHFLPITAVVLTIYCGRFRKTASIYALNICVSTNAAMKSLSLVPDPLPALEFGVPFVLSTSVNDPKKLSFNSNVTRLLLLLTCVILIGRALKVRDKHKLVSIINFTIHDHRQPHNIVIPVMQYIRAQADEMSIH